MNTSKIVNFFFEIATLRRLTRSHRQMIEEVSDNISDHNFRVAVIGMVLANLEQCDEDKVLKMCLFHDVVEARTGDANLVNQQYLDLHEEEARRDQMEGLPIAGEIINLLNELEQNRSKEAAVAWDADSLDQMVLQQEYFYRDEKNKKIWHNNTERYLKTESARRLALKIRKSNPLDWLYSLLEHRTGERWSGE